MWRLDASISFSKLKQLTLSVYVVNRELYSLPSCQTWLLIAFWTFTHCQKLYQIEDGAIIFYKLFSRKPHREMSSITAAWKFFSAPSGTADKTPEAHTVMFPHMSGPEHTKIWIMFKKEWEENEKLLALFGYTVGRYRDHRKCYL